jgi:hypothetical protein
MFVWNSNKHIENEYLLLESGIEQIMKGNKNEYNKGFFATTNVYGNTHFYLLYIYYREGKK